MTFKNKVLFLSALVAVVGFMIFVSAGCYEAESVEVKKECFQGSYEIVDDSDVEFLRPYPCISGDLIVVRSRTETLDLPNLTSVGGTLSISYNDALTNLDGLSSLTSVGNWLAISFNDSLMDLDGLSSLTSVGGLLAISGNPALTNLDGFNSLTSITYDLSISGNVTLTNLDGFSSLTSVGGTLNIFSNVALTNLDGFSSLISVGGSLSISGNVALTNLDAFSSLTSVADVAIYNTALPYCEVCDLLDQFSGFAGATTVFNNKLDSCWDIDTDSDSGSLVCP